jgi:outer membrane protein OmpA-like peptidoglycan-associated protein
MRNYLFAGCCALLLAQSFPALAQPKEAPITLINPSFEDLPKMGETPSGWYNCGKQGETPPDVQPGGWGVAKPASNGQTYLGLVVRDNESWEGVGQRLSRPLLANHCYEFSLDLCRAELYLSVSRTTGDEVNYAVPARVRIWGGMGYCDARELLAETSVITNTRWLTFNFRFNPKGNYSYLLIEAYYKTPVLFPSNGNILVDNASTIKPLECLPDKMPEAKKPPVASKTPPKTKPTTPKSGTAAMPKVDTPARKPEPKVAETPKMERRTMKTGKIFRLEKVYFDANKYEVKPESETELDNLFDFLKQNPDVVIEVGGHTNNAMFPNEAFALELSTNRAKAVANWLIGRGIATDRVQYKGYGWKYPIQPNTTPEGKKKNQRVEVKVLTMNG